MLLPALIRVLHVDDEESQREFAKMFLEENGVIQVTSVASGKEALQLLEKESYDCVISDYQMNGMTGIQLAEKIKSHISIPFILYTGRGSEEVAEAAFKVGIDDYIRKEIEPAHYQVLAINIQHVVERARGEKSLKVSEEKFRRFFMNQPVLCYMVSKEGNIVEVNETVTDALGYTREELIGKPVITTLFSPSSRGKAEQLFRRWVETGEIRNEELKIVTKNGEERTVLLNVDAVRDESGGIIQSISVQVDITQRRQMEDEARIHHEESERHALILENMSDSVIVTDLDGVISYWNDGAKNIFGYSSEEMIGKSVKLLNLVEERGAVADSQLDAVRRGESYPTEWRGLKKNGSELWLFLHTKLLKDHEGNPAGMIGVGKDITQRRQAEEYLRESEERYRTLVENSPNAISVTIGNTIVYANQKRADLAGEKDPSELVITSALSQVAEGDRESIIEMMEARERGEKPPSPLE
ncbi:PAS domain S-box protein, partial [Candidatus Bathyarchaeota archaeon]|nr:PAS domain S-box protein [Candidatus Bathyarchaeota archaeon]